MIYKKIATIHPDGKVVVEVLRTGGSVEEAFNINDYGVLYYLSVEALPVVDRDKMNLLRWLPINDTEPIEHIGCRVGENMFWLT